MSSLALERARAASHPHARAARARVRTHSAYMSIITFTTVGLGDYAPPFFDPGRPLWYQAGGYMMGAVMCLLGLAMLSTLLGATELWVRKDVSVMGLKMMKRGSVQVKMAAVKALSPKISPLRSASMRRELPESPSSANGESKEPNAASATPAAP